MGFIGDTIGGIFGGGQEDAAGEAAQAQVASTREAIAAQERAAELGQTRLAPFQPIIDRSIAGSSFLADPQAQFDFLQSNPLFDLALQNANQQTQQQAAAQGRLSAGDTLQQLSQNVLLSSQPLIDRQRQDVSNLLNLGTGIARTQANVDIGAGSAVAPLLQDVGAAQAGGIIGAANAQAQGTQNLLGGIAGGLSGAGILGGTGIAGGGLTGGLLGGLLGLSDIRLKDNIRFKEKRNGIKWYTWEWNGLARELFGKIGKSEGVLAQEVGLTHPDAVGEINGFMAVNYGKLEA